MKSVPFRTRVKICGITRLEDALAAAEYGADAVGFVFYEKSPRALSPDDASSICARLPAFVTKTALFLDADRRAVESVLDTVPVDLLQFHGSEDAAFCRSFNRAYIKALGMIQDRANLVAQAAQYHDALGLLLDSHAPGAAGGTGETFDWTSIPAELEQPVILAGGLDAGNIASAIEHVHPWAVDISSGVEVGKGIKSAAKIRAFMQEVNKVDG
jgi:phosphoribosylanthranilate isomerase